MTEPRTEAGRTLLKEWGPTDDPEYPQVGKYHDYRADFIQLVLSIEAEAIAAYAADLRADVQALISFTAIGTVRFDCHMVCQETVLRLLDPERSHR